VPLETVVSVAVVFVSITTIAMVVVVRGLVTGGCLHVFDQLDSFTKFLEFLYPQQKTTKTIYQYGQLLP